MDEKRLVQLLDELLDKKLDGMGQRFDQVETRLDGMGQRFDQVETRLDSMDQRFDQVDERFNGLEGRIDRFEKRTVTMFKQLNDKFDDGLIEVKSDIKHVSDKLDKQQGVIDLLARRSIEQEARLVKAKM